MSKTKKITAKSLRKAIDEGMSVREAAKHALASLDLAIVNAPKNRAYQVGVKWMGDLIRLVLDDEAPEFDVGMCAGQGGCEFMVADDPETLDVIYYAGDEAAANHDCRVLNKFVNDLYREPKVFETEYSVSPRIQDKMNKVFDSYGVEWTHVEWDDEGDMAGTVSGEKESVVKFVMDMWKVSRRKALKDISERKATSKKPGKMGKTH